MPQLDFNVAFVNSIFIVIFFIFFYIFFYFLIFQKLFKIIFLKNFFIPFLEKNKNFSFNLKIQKSNSVFFETKKILFLFKNIN